MNLDDGVDKASLCEAVGSLFGAMDRLLMLLWPSLSPMIDKSSVGVL